MLLNARMPKSLSFTRNTGISSTRKGESNKQSKVISLNEKEQDVSKVLEIKIAKYDSDSNIIEDTSSLNTIIKEEELNADWTMQEIEDFIATGLAPERSISSNSQIVDNASTSMDTQFVHTVNIFDNSLENDHAEHTYTLDDKRYIKNDLLTYVSLEKGNEFLNSNYEYMLKKSIDKFDNKNVELCDHIDEEENIPSIELMDIEYRDSDSGFADWLHESNAIKQFTKNDIDAGDVYQNINESTLYYQSHDFQSPDNYFSIDLEKPIHSPDDQKHRMNSGAGSSCIMISPNTESPVSLSKRASPIDFNLLLNEDKSDKLDSAVIIDTDFSVVKKRKSRNLRNSILKNNPILPESFDSHLCKESNFAKGLNSSQLDLFHGIDEDTSRKMLTTEKTSFSISVNKQENYDVGNIVFYENLGLEFCEGNKNKEEEWNLVKTSRRTKQQHKIENCNLLSNENFDEFFNKLDTVKAVSKNETTKIISNLVKPLKCFDQTYDALDDILPIENINKIADIPIRDKENLIIKNDKSTKLSNDLNLSHINLNIDYDRVINCEDFEIMLKNEMKLKSRKEKHNFNLRGVQMFIQKGFAEISNLVDLGQAKMFECDS